MNNDEIKKIMNYFTDEYHPNVNDHPNGTTVFWSGGHPDQLEIMTWTRYSSGTGEYNATKARFVVDEETKSLRLEHVAVKYINSPWDETLSNPARYVSDRMKRILHDFIAKEKGSEYWRVKL